MGLADKIRKYWDDNVVEQIPDFKVIRKEVLKKEGYLPITVILPTTRSLKNRLLNSGRYLKGCPFDDTKLPQDISDSYGTLKDKYLKNRFNIIINTFATDYYHVLYVTKEHIPMSENKDLYSDIILMSKNQNLLNSTIFKNEKGSGATIPEHEHFQAFIGIIPISQYSPEIFCTAKGGVDIARYEGFIVDGKGASREISNSWIRSL